MDLILLQVNYSNIFFSVEVCVDPTNSSNALVYYNARNGWLLGIETIGVSKLLLDTLYSRT